MPANSVRHRHAAEGVEPAVLQVAQARREAEAEQREEAEDLVGRAAGVGVVLGGCAARVPWPSRPSRTCGASQAVAAMTLVWNGPNWSETWV